MAREPEVADVGALCFAIATEEDVAGLHIAVHKAGGVSRVEGLGDLVQ